MSVYTAEKKLKLHVSALNMLTRCGEQYRRRYIENERIPPGFSLVVGRATDAPVNADLENKIQKGELLPDEAIKDLARDSLVKEWEGGIQLEKEYADLGYKKAQAVAIDTAVTCASMHHEEVAPALQPTHVQRYWRIDIEHIPVELTGIIDVQEGASAVRDTKTSKKSPSADEADNSLQLTTYSMALKVVDGAAPEKVWLDYLIYTKTPKLVQLESKRQDPDYEHVLRRIYNAYDCIEKGVFVPAGLDHWACSEKWCGYWQTCPYARHPLTVSVPAAVPPAPKPENSQPASDATVDRLTDAVFSNLFRDEKE